MDKKYAFTTFIALVALGISGYTLYYTHVDRQEIIKILKISLSPIADTTEVRCKKTNDTDFYTLNIPIIAEAIISNNSKSNSSIIEIEAYNIQYTFDSTIIERAYKQILTYDEIETGYLYKEKRTSPLNSELISPESVKSEFPLNIDAGKSKKVYIKTYFEFKIPKGRLSEIKSDKILMIAKQVNDYLLAFNSSGNQHEKFIQNEEIRFGTNPILKIRIRTAKGFKYEGTNFDNRIRIATIIK